MHALTSAVTIAAAAVPINAHSAARAAIPERAVDCR
jgi:hypothetical protein